MRHVARRTRPLGGDQEDIVQVGTIGLIKAIDRFQLGREVEFATFAVPCVVGEIKRFFRDAAWGVHVPRQLRELRAGLRAVTEEPTGRLGREPGVRELAGATGHSEETVAEARPAGNAYRVGSIDGLLHEGRGGGTTLADFPGAEDPRIDMLEYVRSLAPLMARLDERQRRVLRMRFGDEMTQAQIGAALGISQMHVSRLLTRSLRQLRAGMTGTG
ncbi:SigB/SigF/SigG family RNA polymerase sigma factor [Streptomyces sp. LP05-1]|uniref:SigB/SigF/SigG family RNA polymerase sigma factor n=1 Tax=Streptomyces pyxinae TaxID=2970734 RepID=A0ABT2CH66_9ACTN|nr:SigB/SigF/SigG family RNA polymerase sigma factor [Streptomyces sp. LP05-1]MCS0636645.1 SigB/SigF/SigG family RNA polymerase sigma factor [Streptomyces sp. LP05-1]